MVTLHVDPALQAARARTFETTMVGVYALPDPCEVDRKTRARGGRIRRGQHRCPWLETAAERSLRRNQAYNLLFLGYAFKAEPGS